LRPKVLQIEADALPKEALADNVSRFVRDDA
jgi:hypothetical protein